MATQNNFKEPEVSVDNPLFSSTRVIIETAFYGNNVSAVKDLDEAYELAKNCPGTIVTDMDVFESEKIGLKAGTKILLSNDGATTGRDASARVILGVDTKDSRAYELILREAIYNGRSKKFYKSEALIGLEQDFMVKAHLMIPEEDVSSLYSWLLNFQYINDTYQKMYQNSKPLEKEGDIYVYVDSAWAHKDFPSGLVFFDPAHNAAAILGMRYFGELKKGTLTMAWAIASRNGYVSCHGGLKKYEINEDRSYVAAVFGLSGSGKSTITHARHNGKYADITILHDDAFIINTTTGDSIALEPSYFDKTADYTSGCEDNKYIITAQNMGATLNHENKIVPVTEDLRNPNGRAIKSKLWSKHRVDKIDEHINAIFWLMKDSTLPPIVKITDGELAASMGLTLATKRTSAEKIKEGVDPNAIVMEPYANPFRIYPLSQDFEKFRDLFVLNKVDCYILNTSDFMGKKVTPAITLNCIESVVEGNAKFMPFGQLPNMEILEIDGFMPDFNSVYYVDLLKERFAHRIAFLEAQNDQINGFNQSPAIAVMSLKNVYESL